MKRYNLKIWRMRQELTQAQTAEKLGISRGYYKDVENGVHDPSKKMLDRFVAAYGLHERDLEKLLKKEENVTN